jgi:hypothetical protein
MSKPEKSRKKPDWEAIERQYRLGQKSMRVIADEYGVNVSNISRRAKRDGWVQDKSDEIRQRTNASLAAQQERNTPTREDIEVAVQTNRQVIINHRKSIKSGQHLVDLLHSQLQQAAEHRAEIEDEIFDATQGEDGKPDLKRRNAMLKAVSLPAHVGTLRDLSTALKNLVALERQAFNIDSQSSGDTDPVSNLLDEVAKRAAPLVRSE